MEIVILNASNKRLCLKLQKYSENKSEKAKKSSKISKFFMFIWLVLHFKNIGYRSKAFV
jgi:hypothetical protein